jgi:hypothetical protein
MTSRTEYSTQTPKKSTLFWGQYLRKHWTLYIGVLGYSGVVWPKEHSSEVRSFHPGTLCIKSVLWRVAKCLSYIEDARCLKVKHVRRPTIAGLVSWQWILSTLHENLRCITQLIQGFLLTLDRAVSGSRPRPPEFIWRDRRQRCCLISLHTVVFNC